MDQLVKPHGKEKKLKPLLLTGTELDEETKKAKALKQIVISSRETGDAIMLGIGGSVTITVFLVTELGYRRFFNRNSQIRQEVLDLRL